MDRRRELDRLLAEALEQPTATRKAFLDNLHESDPELGAALARLLREAGDTDAFLQPGGAFAGPLWEEMAAPAPQLAAGARLGPYEIHSAIGAGGMGEVYRARDTRLERDVAIKILPASGLSARDALARFEREARAIAALNHPNILAIHDVGSDGGRRFVVTELLEGETLRTRLTSGQRMTPSKAVEYGIQIAHALAAAHSRGIIHRDLKPENVFITGDGRVKILDFGIAAIDAADAAHRDDTRLTHPGVVLGTTGYMSPEQMLGRPATPQSDLFAFGVVLHEMVTGSHPFQRTTAAEMQTAVLRDDPPSIIRVSPNVAPAIARLVERCLQKQPADRPETARDVAMFLEAIAGSVETGAAFPAVGAQRGLAPRTRLLAIASGMFLLLMAVVFGYVRVATEGAARDTIEADFARAERSVRRLHTEQVTRLGLTARLVTSFPELKALFATDLATVEDFLLGYQQRLAKPVLFVALGPDGSLLGRTDTTPSAGRADGEDWPKILPALQGDGATIPIGGRPHVAVAAASEAGGTVFGHVVAAEPINQTFAETVRQETQDEVVLLSRDGILGSTLRAAETPWPTLEAWRAAGGRADATTDVRIGSQRYAAREVTLAGDPAVSVVLVKSRDEALRPFLRVERGILAVAAIALAAALAGGVWLARYCL